MSTPIFGAPRGMRDFYPDEMLLRNHIFRAWTDAARRFGFEPYDACVVETLDLLKRKGGEEIAEQIYTFKDKSDRDLALRPEMTPSLARMVAARQHTLAFPIKWTTVAQCFRYERMSRGRKREHYQWNLDIVGEDGVAAEAEVLACALTALGQLGLGPDSMQVHVNSRALLAELLLSLGIQQEHHAATFLALDKRGKISDEEIRALLDAAGLGPDATAAVFRMLSVQNLDEAAALLDQASPAVARLRALFVVLSAYGFGDALVFDIAVIRGLGYYTGIVFEAFDRARQFRALFGGGRYDNLLASVGGHPMTAVGLGFGDVVIGELLAETGKLPAPGADGALAIGYMDAAQQPAALNLAQVFRKAGRTVDLALHADKPRAFFARVGTGRFQYAIYLGPDDIARGVVRVKRLTDRTEHELALAELSANPALLEHAP